MSLLLNTFSELKSSTTSISKKTGKSKFLIMIDMCYCMFKYFASPKNYEYFEFYNLDKYKRSTYVTYGLSRKMIKKFNNPSDIFVLENKLEFAKAFSDMFNREYLNVTDMTYDDFEKFCRNKNKFICKPYCGSQGANIKVCYINEDLRKVYDSLKSEFPIGYMLEEWISQHHVLQTIYPNAVNCLRIITLYDGNETHLITGGVTFGISTEIANGSQPSIIAPIDFDTGIMHKPAATFGSELYEKHPTTCETIVGVQLPYWTEIQNMLHEACKRIPTIRYVGWDIAVTPTGPVLIEGNTTPGYKYYQIPNHLNDGIGNREKYEKFLTNS